MLNIQQATETMPDAEFRRWLVAAQGGSFESVGRVVEVCRDYLLLVADLELPRQLRATATPSDVVHQTSLDLSRDFAKFGGCTRSEWLAWARRLLLNHVAGAVRQHLTTAPRDGHREVPTLGSARLSSVPAPGITYSEDVQETEEDSLRTAIDALPEECRTVVTLHHQEGLSFDEIADRTSRPPEMVINLWASAVQRLGRTLRGAS